MDEQKTIDGLRTRFVQVDERERAVAARERVAKVAEHNLAARFASVTAREEAAKKLEGKLQAWAARLSAQTETNFRYADKLIKKPNQLRNE